jgi:hypothetical protein
MPVYLKKNFDIFMKKVKEANSSFERVKTSSLRPLINILQDVKCSSQLVSTQLRKLPAAKQQKYWSALLHLRQNFPQLPLIPMLGGTSLKKLNAAKFVRNTTLPAHWTDDFSGQAGANKLCKKQGYGDDAPFLFEREIASQSNAFLNKSLEHYIFENRATVAGVLIHMGQKVSEMDNLVEGVSHTEHIISVINALAGVNAPLCVLLQNTDTVCAQLREPVSRCNTTTVIEKKGHMGGQKAEFQEFVSGKTIIMMGYDGDVCVAANTFGSDELMHTTVGLQSKGRLVTPIINLADVVTSRAVLVTGAKLSKVDKWGVLHNT